MLNAKDVMKTNLVTVDRKTTIYDAIRIMVDNNITGLPVVNDDMTLAGIISEKDVLKLLYDIEDKPGHVENFMTKQVITFNHDDSLIDIAESFITNQFRRVPILKDEKIVGIISRKDVVAYILKLKYKDMVTA